MHVLLRVAPQGVAAVIGYQLMTLHFTFLTCMSCKYRKTDKACSQVAGAASTITPVSVDTIIYIRYSQG